MSDTPDKNHPWARFGADPAGKPPTPKPDAPRRPVPARPAPKSFTGKPAPRVVPPKPLSRPPVPAPLTPGTPEPTKPPEVVKAGSIVSDELAAALNQLAAEYAAPAATSTPFITAMQREQEARERKHLMRLRMFKLGAVAVFALVALHLTITRILYRTPTAAALAAHVESLPDVLLPLYSSARQPLQPAGVVYAETDRVGANRIRYAAEITLKLRKPLYLPASTNGTEAYRQMQESLLHARQRDLKFSLFPSGHGPELPALPRLIQMSHRAGDAIVVRLPFEARRFGWGWRLHPAQIGLRSVNRSFAGDSVELYADAPYLIFGAPGSLAEVRLLMRKARAYIVAVAQEVQKRSMLAAVDVSPADPAALADAVALDPAADGDPANKPAVALDDLERLFDPNAPAVDLAVDPDRPADSAASAIDSHAPALPAAKAEPEAKSP